MHILAAREALERFATELPLAQRAERVARLASTTRQLFDQALAEADPQSPAARVSLSWADHDLAVLLADALVDPQLAAAARPLFLGVRRRLVDALEREPHDLAPALALAHGIEASLADQHQKDDPRLAADLQALGRAVESPHVGARLATAAVSAVVAASQARDKGLQAAATDTAHRVKDALDRAAKRLPHHPVLLLDRVRLVLLSARAADGAGRKALVAEARGLLSDHEATFGPSAIQRDVQAQLVAVSSRDEAPADLARDVVRLLELDQKERSVDPRRALKLVRTLARAHALEADTARTIQRLLGITAVTGSTDSADQADDPALLELRGHLFSATGDESSLVSLNEQQLAADPSDQQAARVLFERLLKNLRNDLPSPFSSVTLDLLTQAVPFPALGRLSADDTDALLTVLRATFGTQRALVFARSKLTVARELKGKDFVWKRALALADEVGDDEARLDIARRAMRDGNLKNLPEARIILAKALIARGEDLDEADDALKPLTHERGPLATEAQHLKARIKSDPRYRHARLAALIAFEEQLGIGTARQHPLRVVFTSPGYLLAEVVERQAPDFYDHRHLRVMIRAEDLPGGVKPNQLQKGDALEAPIRGQDANPERDKEGLRIYWVADPRRITIAPRPVESAPAKTADAAPDKKADSNRPERPEKKDAAKPEAPVLTPEQEAEQDQAFGIGSGAALTLRVAWDGRRKRLIARLYDANNNEFRVRPKLDPTNLPEGMEPPQCGSRGKRFLGVVDKVEGAYRIVGRLELAAPLKGGKDDAEGEAEAGPEAETGETDGGAT
jgi:hypothetical protein